MRAAFAKPPSRASQKRKARTAENKETAEVRRLVFERDGYHCRACVDIRPAGFLQHEATDMHEIVFRSQNGRRTVDNCLALCHSHHMAIHSRRLWIVGTDASGPLTFTTEKPA